MNKNIYEKFGKLADTANVKQYINTKLLSLNNHISYNENFYDSLVLIEQVAKLGANDFENSLERLKAIQTVTEMMIEQYEAGENAPDEPFCVLIILQCVTYLIEKRGGIEGSFAMVLKECLSNAIQNSEQFYKRSKNV